MTALVDSKPTNRTTASRTAPLRNSFPGWERGENRKGHTWAAYSAHTSCTGASPLTAVGNGPSWNTTCRRSDSPLSGFGAPSW